MKKISLMLSILATLSILSAAEINLDGKTIQLKSKASGNCIQVEGNSDKEGNKLIQYPCEKGNSLQEITFTKTDGNYYKIALNNKQLTVPLQSQSNGVNILQSNIGSLFKITSKEGAFTLQAKHSNKYVSITSYNTDIIQEGEANQTNQLWTVYSDTNLYTTCKEILDAGKSIGDGIYTIDPDDNGGFEVYCDMTTDGGGWTRIVGDIGTLTMSNSYLNQFMSNPEVNKIAQWISNSDGSYEAPAINCRDDFSLRLKESLFNKSSEVRVIVSGEAGTQHPNNCSGWGGFGLYNSSNFSYYLLHNAAGSAQKYGKNIFLKDLQLKYENYLSGTQIIQLKDLLILNIAYKGTPRHIFDISIR